MDSIASIYDRISAIRGTIASIAPQSPAPRSAETFASVLATEATKGAEPAAPISLLPVQKVGAYGPEQLANASAIISAAKAMGLSARDQAIGVMTAIGESSLKVIDRGDAAGPDSRGLFQQRANGAWGSYADRMSPTVSATNFFRALAEVKGRDGITPTLVAHAVQRNADAQYYTKYWDAAVEIVSKLTGATTGQVTGT